jgi:hypothetical protein
MAIAQRAPYICRTGGFRELSLLPVFGELGLFHSQRQSSPKGEHLLNRIGVFRSEENFAVMRYLSESLRATRRASLLEPLQFRRRYDQLRTTTIQTDRDFLANIDRREVGPLQVRKTGRQFSLQPLQVRRTTSFTSHANLRTECVRLGRRGWTPLFADPEACEPEGFTLAHTPLFGHSGSGNPCPEYPVHGFWLSR